MANFTKCYILNSILPSFHSVFTLDLFLFLCRGRLSEVSCQIKEKERRYIVQPFRLKKVSCFISTESFLQCTWSCIEMSMVR